MASTGWDCRLCGSNSLKCARSASHVRTTNKALAFQQNRARQLHKQMSACAFGCAANGCLRGVQMLGDPQLYDRPLPNRAPRRLPPQRRPRTIRPALLVRRGEQRQVVAADQLLRPVVAERRGRLVGAQPRQLLRLLGRVVHHRPADLHAVRVEQLHRLLLAEVSHHAACDHARGEERRAAPHGLRGALVEVELAADGQRHQPALVAAHHLALREERRAHLLRALQHRGDRVRLLRVHDGRRDARRARQLRRAELGRHPAGAPLGAAALRRAQHREDVVHHVDRRRRRLPRLWRRGGVGGVERVDVCREEEVVGADERGDERRERVVVAEAQLVHRDRVVLVDDRHDAEREEAVERRLRVEVSAAAAEAVGGEEDLRDRLRERVEERVVVPHQVRLPDRRHRLQLAQRRRARLHAQPLAADTDGAGGDEDDVVALRA
mmetsp:Transcript_1353/g.3479  ORF Transcript_1353/g.3479 Transcript_1353/m.3479 type:complete len:437 (-) Transcript_1353:114-1424(-)